MKQHQSVYDRFKVVDEQPKTEIDWSTDKNIFQIYDALRAEGIKKPGERDVCRVLNLKPGCTGHGRLFFTFSRYRWEYQRRKDKGIETNDILEALKVVEQKLLNNQTDDAISDVNVLIDMMTSKEIFVTGAACPGQFS